MNDFDFSAYDIEDNSYTPVKSKPTESNKKEESSSFDFSAYDPEEILTQKEKPKEDSFWKSAARTALQIPQGLAEGTTYGITTGLLHLLGMDVYDPVEIDRLREISEREGIPFDEEKYLQGANQALSLIPTISNLASAIEEKTGIPLEPKTKLQKFFRLSSLASKVAPQPGGFRGTSAGFSRPVLGAGVGATSQLAQAAGVPEPLADLASFGVLKGLPTGTQPTQVLPIKRDTGPSGLTKRGFENLTKPREVSQNKLVQINEKVGNDFRKISDEIIQASPVGETAQNLRNDPTFKQQSKELLNQAQEIADQMPQRFPSRFVKDELMSASKKAKTGFIDNEYDRSFQKFMKEATDRIGKEDLSPSQLVQQYRKNNRDLSEYFEPGASKAFNRAKRDSLLEQNRAIASFMEKAFPESEFVNVFKEGNERWKKIMDIEVVDDFINGLFDEKINYKKGHLFFDDPNTERIFKRALGKNYPQFESLMTDLLSSERGYNMLKKAKEQGFNDLFQAGVGYIIHPEIGMAKAGLSQAKGLYKFTLNSILDKPKLTIGWKKGLDALKKGDFRTAEREFKGLNAEILPSEPKLTPTAKGGQTLEAKVEPIRKEPKFISGEQKKAIEYKEPIKVTPKTQEKEGTEFRDRFMSKMDEGISERLGKPEKVKPKTAKKNVEIPKKQEEKIEKAAHQDISKKGLKDQKIWLKKKIEEAIQDAPETANFPNRKKYKSIYQYEDAVKKWEADKNIKSLTFKVPGDGTFTIKNHQGALKKFLESVDKRWPDRPLKVKEKKPFSNYKNLDFL